MSRRRVYEANEVAEGYVQKFHARPVREEHDFDFDWPDALQHVGDSLAVAYASDKWKNKGDFELYKHLAESPNRAYVKKGLLRDWDSEKPVRTIGPMVSFERVPMPKQFAILGYFEEANFRLHTSGTARQPYFGEHEDDGCVAVAIGDAWLGASKIRWSEVSDRDDQPFLFVYTKSEGPLILVTGEDLDVEKDGIVG
jgi:hypothetical protein